MKPEGFAVIKALGAGAGVFVAKPRLMLILEEKPEFTVSMFALNLFYIGCKIVES